MLQKRERFLSCGNTRLYCAPTLATYVFYAYFTNSTKYSILNIIIKQRYIFKTFAFVSVWCVQEWGLVFWSAN